MLWVLTRSASLRCFYWVPTTYVFMEQLKQYLHFSDEKSALSVAMHYILKSFYRPGILLYILKSISCLNTILSYLESVWPEVWPEGPQNKYRLQWPIFHGPVILHYILKCIWCINIKHLDYESVWPEVWPQNKCWSGWPTFHGPVIALYLEEYLMYKHHTYMSHYDPKFDLQLNVGYSDLHFTVQ